jgi:multiple sugar transport system ATP-binding protein
VAETLGIATCWIAGPGQLSGGQRQRVAMGRAVLRRPQAFLFDEPLSNLDAKLRVQMRTEIKALHQRLGTTTVYVTHDQVEAMTMADRIVVLKDGVIEQQGAPLDLYDRPAQRLRGRLHRLAGDELIVGLRAEAVGLAANEAAAHASQCLVNARVQVVEPTGADTLVLLDLGGHDFTARLPPDVTLQAGAQARFAIDLSKIVFFDTETETLID